jgi:hypothetical protein
MLASKLLFVHVCSLTSVANHLKRMLLTDLTKCSDVVAFAFLQVYSIVSSFLILLIFCSYVSGPLGLFRLWWGLVGPACL